VDAEEVSMVGSTAQRYTTLTVDALADALRSLPGWAVEHGHLVRRVAVRDPWRLLERVSQVEVELDHHSVVALDRGALVFSVWTHVKPGLTTVDVELAHRIEEAARVP
jgi:4a-hydroxytetrahydrobiopterin dehydratase